MKKTVKRLSAFPVSFTSATLLQFVQMKPPNFPESFFLASAVMKRLTEDPLHIGHIGLHLVATGLRLSLDTRFLCPGRSTEFLLIYRLFIYELYAYMCVCVYFRSFIHALFPLM